MEGSASSGRHALLRLDLTFIASGSRRKLPPKPSFRRSSIARKTPRQNQIYSSPRLLHVGKFHRSIEISSDTTKLPITPGITENPSRSIHKTEILTVRFHRYTLNRRRKTVRSSPAEVRSDDGKAEKTSTSQK